jgi:hypothetical protein
MPKNTAKPASKPSAQKRHSKGVSTALATPAPAAVVPTLKPRNPVLAALKAASTGKRAGKHEKTESALRRQANVALQAQLRAGK